MADWFGKLHSLLDQLLPFLLACPPWLRFWVHALILLNFLTVAGVAVVYLHSKEKAAHEGSLSYFSISTPTDGQQIPLSDAGTWMMLNGALPKTKEADFNVQILRLPDGQPVPQTGQKIKSSQEGHWSFEPAKFAGDGSYKIIATGLLNGESQAQEVTVTCYGKAAEYKLSIEREKLFRTDAVVVALSQGAATLDQAKEELSRHQDSFIAAAFKPGPLTNDELQQALDIVDQALDRVDSVLPLWPDDLQLQRFRAYFLKDYAQVVRALKRPGAEQALDESRQMFEAALAQNPLDSNAWNGLGSVYLESGQPSKAIYYIKRALQLAPDNHYAQHDLAAARRTIEEQERATAGK
jgi:tetratricopeptide (TPR) repeat protein